MSSHRVFRRVSLLLVLFALLLPLELTPVAQAQDPAAQAQGPSVTARYREMYRDAMERREKRITHSDRVAAAKRAKDKGFKVQPRVAKPKEGTEPRASAAMDMPGTAPRYFSHPNYANSPLPVVDATSGAISGGIEKFVDTLAGLGPGGVNDLGNYIPVAVPDQETYPGADYYEIAVVQYRHQFHEDVPAALVRGYVQLSTSKVPGEQAALSNALLDGSTAPINGYKGVTPPHYLGPAIVATKDRPVRILFRNLLPTGVDGNLFIPVDTTVMGSGMGPNMGGMIEMDPLNPMCGEPGVKDPDCFSENRATLHLHGGITPWISDGTAHQWITPAGENTSYPRGVSVVNVPDMPDPGAGAMTFFYTNQQSARLMFYHDHAWGITRLNVYAGEAAPYIITDDTEESLLSRDLIPGPEDTIPLVVQDKTFVPSMEQLMVSDETWDASRWGGEGNLWLPHVYSPAQNPGDSSGVNQFGRWAYGPWFWPPTNVPYGPVPNPYYDPDCDPDLGWCEPEMMPGTPFNSMGMEAFHDTPVVNGTAYPKLTVEPKAYRFRILNASSDRFWNLSLYQADPAAPTEVQLNPAEVAAALEDQTICPTPVEGTEGPDWIQIGTEGGFLPTPVVIPAQPTTWVNDPTVFNAGNVDQHSLLLGPAERADVIVDFSQYAGQTLILYNDAPAAFPARDPRYDYYTGNADLRETGGAPSTLPGYGPNTRTVMQIVVEGTAAPAFNTTPLFDAFKHQPDGSGVFESGQHPIIVGQGPYNSAYGTSFQTNGPLDGMGRIQDFDLTFNTLSGVQIVDMPTQGKMIQDEMGEAFDPDYGRMSGNLGLEVPLTQAGVQQNMILYPFVNPASELIDATDLPRGLTDVAPIAVANDGTQIWRITHNGVDTHPIHFHLFDVQLINRVGWDGIIRRPDPNELGWKDTVRISPLEDTFLALRPVIPVVPFSVPNSIRPLNPMMPIGSMMMFNSTDANADPTEPIRNEMTNFGDEYVWHCHILSHEEMDMMRPISVAAPPVAPLLSGGTVTGSGATRQVVLNWTDRSTNETAFVIQEGPAIGGPWTDIGSVGPNVTTYADVVGTAAGPFFYRVVAINTVGYNATPGYSTMTVSGASDSLQVNAASATPPTAPTNLTGAVQSGPQVLLNWSDNSNNENFFIVQRAIGSGSFSQLVELPPNTTSYTDTAISGGTTYRYRVRARNGAGTSSFTNIVTVAVPSLPTSPNNLTLALLAGPALQLRWNDRASDETGFVIQRAINNGAWATLTEVGPRSGTGNVTYTDNAVTSGTTYTYRVAAKNAAGQSAWSNTAARTVTSGPPPRPASLKATAVRAGTTDTVSLTWPDVTGETSYEIQRATDSTFTSNRVTYTPAANATSLQIPGLNRFSNYYFRIRARNASGNSAWRGATPFPIRTP